MSRRKAKERLERLQLDVTEFIYQFNRTKPKSSRTMSAIVKRDLIEWAERDLRDALIRSQREERNDDE
jgi:hypothetical protein